MPWLYDNENATVFPPPPPDSALSNPCVVFVSPAFQLVWWMMKSKPQHWQDPRWEMPSWGGVHDTLNTCLWTRHRHTRRYRIWWRIIAHARACQFLGTAIQQSRRAARRARFTVHFEHSAQTVLIEKKKTNVFFKSHITFCPNSQLLPPGSRISHQHSPHTRAVIAFAEGRSV